MKLLMNTLGALSLIGAALAALATGHHMLMLLAALGAASFLADAMGAEGWRRID